MILAAHVGPDMSGLTHQVVALQRRVHHLQQRPRLVVVQKTRVVYVQLPPPAPQVSYATSTGHDWSATAECESGGDWSITSGIGPDVSGGLQIAQATWEANGGLDYAPAPYLASPAEQIAVAERILATQGSGAWPNCPTP